MAGDVDAREWLPSYFVVLSGLSLAFLGVRITARLQRDSAGFGLDDIAICVAWGFSSAVTILASIGTLRDGFGQHESELEPSQLTSALETAWICNVLYLGYTGFTKLSVLLFYQRLVKGTWSPRFNWALGMLMAVIAIYTLVSFVLYITGCIPVQGIWMQYDSAWADSVGHYCASQSQTTGTAWTVGVTSTATNLAVVALPILLTGHVHFSSRARYALYAIFIAGFLASVPSGVRAYYLIRAEDSAADSIWNSFNATVAGKTEGDFGIMCACAPCLQILFNIIRERRGSADWFGSLHGRSRDSVVDPPRRGSERSIQRSGSAPSGGSRRNSHKSMSGRSESGANVLVSRPPSGLPRVLYMSEKSDENIAEAYGDPNKPKLRKPLVEDGNIEAGPSSLSAWKEFAPQLRGSPVPRPDTTTSWLSMAPSSENDEAELTGQWYPHLYVQHDAPSALPKNQPNR